ncbi:nuclear transport factor 2 family protein [Solirubrobacter sp. CPCC 204708]|uniref:Nuclear transport factor 2 family protein n=1 Tax=Solirubrobacter deserti TaxID=2282478 RepID=A0ABT4RPU8_9ACTN|nr:nuclear transport factor 2 family protein [Solirubrobacter deserti]MBE2318242.1 nuclear transport factor 2 family protein [Solirubrobacter deserti]MDA0140580.1 nuclear transport factor 2 family protein [Solirubrobacter deserti]
MLPDRLREAFDWMETVVALPPATAVEVECPLVHRLYTTREWEQTRPMLADDFVLIGPNGGRAGLDALRRTNELMAGAYEDLHAEIETVVSDPAAPRVLYVRDHSRGRAKDSGERLDVRAWSRVVLTEDGTQVRELGPSSVINRA